MAISNAYMPRNVGFRVESMYMSGRVGRIRPDMNGIYSGLPMMILGEVTQQKTYYDPASVVEQITNPESRFHKVLSQNKLGGEWGHPAFYGMTTEDQLQRLVTVDESKLSHIFTALYTDDPSPDGTTVLRGNIKPTGPMGNFLKDSLDDPVTNTAFSLRAYVNTEMKPNGIKFRTVRQLTTFDTVVASGYAGTDKAHAIGLEHFAGDDYNEYEISVMEDGNLMIDQIALESFSNTDLNEIFGVSKISKIVQSRTFVETDKSVHERFPNMYRNSIFNDFFKE